MSIEYAFGLRHPDSEEGSWDRAFVVCKLVGSSNISIVQFLNNTFFIHRSDNLNEALKIQNIAKKEGYKMRMTIEDINITCGFNIGENAIINYNKLVSKKTNKIKRCIQVCTSAFVLGIFIKKIFFRSRL